MSRRLERIERQSKRKNYMKDVLLLLAILFVVAIIYKLGTSLIATVDQIRRDVQLVEYGTVEDKLVGKAIVLNKEKVILAGTEGRLENMVKENEKISKGTLLGYYITSYGKTSQWAPESGRFVRNTDGLEEVLDNLVLQAVTPEAFQYKPVHPPEDQPIQPGQPMYKIVDSLVPTRLIISFPLDDIMFEIKDGQSVKVLLGEKVASGIIMEMKRDFEELIILLKLNSFAEETINERYMEISVVFNAATGFLIPEKALVEKDGKKGIYCVVGEFTKFKPVEVIRVKDDIVVVKGLDKNDFILMTPPDKI